MNDSIMNFMEKMGMPDHIAKYVAACGGEEPFLVDDVEASKGEKAGEEDHMIEGSEKRGASQALSCPPSIAGVVPSLRQALLNTHGARWTG